MQLSASLPAQLRRIGRVVVDGVLPPRCLACGAIVDEPDALCGPCWAGMTFFKQRFGTRREDLPGAWDDVYRPRAYQGFLLAQRARREIPARLRTLSRPGDRAGSPDRRQNDAAPRRQDQV